MLSHHFDHFIKIMKIVQFQSGVNVIVQCDFFFACHDVTVSIIVTQILEPFFYRVDK